MKQSNYSSAILSLSVDRKDAKPLNVQLMQAIRGLILDRKLKSGERLPASRELAQELLVSRSTVTTVYDQLVSEGYLEARRGSGYFVDRNLPDYPDLNGELPVAATPQGSREQPLKPLRAFEASSPDIGSFPYREWARCLEKAWRNPHPDLLARPDPMGWWPLRLAISRHLHEWRGVTSDAAQIVITSGLVEAVNLFSNSVLSTGDPVISEEPGFPPLRNALMANGLDCHFSRVDEQGFDPVSAFAAAPAAKAVFITASRQFPLGMPLPLGRRLELLNWAAKGNRYIVEDDFDSEYRYEGTPLPAMHSLDNNRCVVYLGSFSKVLLPTLRLGYLVIPPDLVPAIRSHLEITGAQASIVAQPALVEFMESGGFATHIRRMRRSYARRLKTILKAIQRHGSDLLYVDQANSGLHVVARFTDELSSRLSDVAAAERAAEAGVSVRALSACFQSGIGEYGLILGFAAFDETEIESGMEKLCRALAE